MTQRRESYRPRRSVVDLNRMPLVYGGQHSHDASMQWPGRESEWRTVPFSRVRALVVALDGSPAAEHALPYALAIARRSGATVRLVHVHSLLDSVEPWQQYYGDKLVERLRWQKQAYLQSVVRRVRRQVEVPIAAVVIESGDIAHSLREAAAGAALVVMATHGRGFVGRLLHGSVADALMRKLPCPLLIVRAHGSVTDDPMPRRVLIPLDGTKSAEKVVDSAAALGGLSGAQLTLAHFQDLEAMLDRSKLANPRRYLLDAARRLKGRVPVVNTEVVVSDERIAAAILSLAEEQEIDWIALTTRGRSGLARLVNWSVADSVVRRAKTPILVVRASNREAKRQDRWLARSLWSWK